MSFILIVEDDKPINELIARNLTLQLEKRKVT